MQSNPVGARKIPKKAIKKIRPCHSLVLPFKHLIFCAAGSGSDTVAKRETPWSPTRGNIAEYRRRPTPKISGHCVDVFGGKDEGEEYSFARKGHGLAFVKERRRWR